MSDPLAALIARLGLSDDEALAIFELDALAVISREHGHRPEVAILDVLTGEADAQLGPGAVARWVRRGGADAPLATLARGEFAQFEDALAGWLRESGGDG